MPRLRIPPEYDEKRTGCSKKELREIALKGIRYLCYTHDTGPADCIRPEKSLGNPATWGTKWGERGRGFFPESQCGTNLSDVGLVALLLGDIVDDETWTMIARMHEDYAERFGAMAPKSGVFTNTQMEENGWTSCGLASVECFLNNSPHVKSWAETARRWMFSTATTQQDTKNFAPFSNGQTVRELTGQTFTALPDYMAENHGMVHPSYTGSSVMFLGRLGIIYGAFGAEVPVHGLFNRQEIYDQLKRTTDRTGSMHPVQGMDWPYLSPDPGTLTHATAALFLNDPDAAYFERQALETLEQRAESAGGRVHDQQIAEIGAWTPGSAYHPGTQHRQSRPHLFLPQDLRRRTGSCTLVARRTQPEGRKGSIPNPVSSFRDIAPVKLHSRGETTSWRCR